MRFAAALLIVSVVLFACDEAGAQDPSIEEMLSVIAKQTEAVEATPTAAPAPQPGGEKPIPAAPEKFERYKSKSDGVKEIEAKIKRGASTRAADYKRRRIDWSLGILYKDIQFNRESATILINKFVAGRAQKREEYHLTEGEAHREAAVVAVILGKQELAEAYAKEAANRATRPHIQGQADRVVRLVDEYERKKAEQTVLEAKFAKDPNDGDTAWKIADSYKHYTRQYFDEVLALKDMHERFPDHKQTKSGEVEWRLAEGYDRFKLVDEALALYLVLDKEHPKYNHVKRGECWWRIAEKLRRRKDWKRARDFYKRMQKEAPKHFICQKRQNQAEATVVTRLRECNANIN